VSRLRVGLDVGTSSAKAAAFDVGGGVVSRARVSLPPVETDGPAAWQPLAEVVAAAERALTELFGSGAEADATGGRSGAAGTGGPGAGADGADVGRADDGGAGTVELVALTAQRDTAVLFRRDGEPLSELISWRDGRAAAAGSLWDALADEEPAALARLGAVRSLPSLLAGRWTGRPMETPATLPLHLRGRSRRRLAARTGGGGTVELPERRPLGEAGAPLRPAGTGLPASLDGVPLHVTAGDKNCEMLGHGVRRPGAGSVSLGSAISLGTLAGGTPVETAGDGPVYRSPAAVPGRENVEVGLVSGLEGESGPAGSVARALDSAGRGAVGDGAAGEGARGAGCPDGRLRTDIWCAPYFRGALDAPGALPRFAGLAGDAEPRELAQAWAQGVAGELRRLRPILERAAGARLERLVVGGGRAASPGWARLLAEALGLPVERAADAWSGARGAVASLQLARGEPGVDGLLAGGPAAAIAEPVLPSSDARVRRRVDRYYEDWERFAAGARRRRE